MAATLMYTATLFFFISVVNAAQGTQEVCQWESFEAKCQEDEVIMITEAHYGRMGIGRCQPRDFGFAGCSADVKDIMNARCSGRQACSVPIPDPIMFAATPCPKDLVTYLQADYTCVNIAKSNVDNCDDHVLTSLHGDIAKPLTNSRRSICPHRILAQPGQTVNVYLYDFYNKDSNTEIKPGCITYGQVSESSTSPMKICGGEFRQNQLIYSSKGNIVDIMLAEGSSHSHHYLLHYEVVGCPTIHAPPNAWIKIEENTAVVMCNFSHIASELACSGNEWVGDIQNCTGIDSDFFMTQSLSITSLRDIVANSGTFAVVCVGLICGLLVGIGLSTLIKTRCVKAKQISELPQTSLEKPALPQNEKSFKPVDQYQPVYVPDTLDTNTHVDMSNLYETTLPAYNAPRLELPEYHTTLGSHVPINQNTYGPLRAGHQVEAQNCRHHLHDLVALGHTLGREKLITIDDELRSPHLHNQQQSRLNDT